MRKSFKNSLGIVSSLLFVGICGEEAQALPSFTWSQAGAISGLVCVRIHEDADPDTWGDNFLCSNEDLGLRWSQAGEIAGMRCTRIYEDSDPHTWGDNFLCTPSNAPYTLSWSQAGAIPGKTCTRIHEDSDPHAWGDNFLCVESGSTASKNFPLRGSQFTELGDHRRMETSITISNNGRIDAVTRIWTAKQFQGFTGAVAVVITDSAGNILHVTEPHSYGVDCKRCPGPSDRTQQWADTVPSNILNQVRGYAIIHTTNPRNRWRDWLRDAKEAAQSIKEIKKEFD
jgi:hypothetical protein